MFRTGTILLTISGKQSCLGQEPFSCLYQVNSYMFRTGTIFLFISGKQPCLKQEHSSCFYSATVLFRTGILISIQIQIFRLKNCKGGIHKILSQGALNATPPPLKILIKWGVSGTLCTSHYLNPLFKIAIHNDVIIRQLCLDL